MSKQATKTDQQHKNNVLSDNIVKSLAHSIFENLCTEGCRPQDIIGVSSQLLSLVTSELQKQEVRKN